MKGGWRAWLGRNSWPLGIVGIGVCFVVADGTLLVTALRDTTFGVEDNYYEKSLRYDETRNETARAAGWSSDIEVADAPIADMPRRVDIRLRDSDGRPVSGLTGRVTAVRPSDARLRNDAAIIEVPGDPGLYRMLLKVPLNGLWEFELIGQKAGESYRLVMRQDVRLAAAGGPPS